MINRLFNKLESIYRYRYLSQKNHNAYQWMLKKVHKGTDIDFLENVWQLDYFREVLEPSALDLTSIKKALVLAPHQDDEVIGCGGTLHHLFENKCDITIGFLTNGAELSNYATSIEVRQKEALLVGKALAAEIRNLGVDNVNLEVEDHHLEKLSTWLNEGWDAVFSVWPIDQPAKHRLCAYATSLALHKSRYTGPILLYAVHTDLIPSAYVDISSVIEQKQKLIHCHQSQMLAQNYGHLSKGLDAWRSRFLPVSPNARFIETFMAVNALQYIEFISIFHRTNTKRLFKGNETCQLSYQKLKSHKLWKF